MANINQIQVDNVTYDVEDNATRATSVVLVTDASGKIDDSDVTVSELNVLDGITASTTEINSLDDLNTTSMGMRQTGLVSADTTPSVNGQINWKYS